MVGMYYMTALVKAPQKKSRIASFQFKLSDTVHHQLV
jgi:hypothetical protein